MYAIPQTHAGDLMFFEVITQIWVGARFEALDELVFMAPSEFFGIFYLPNESIWTLWSEKSYRPDWQVICFFFLPVLTGSSTSKRTLPSVRATPPWTPAGWNRSPPWKRLPASSTPWKLPQPVDFSQPRGQRRTDLDKVPCLPLHHQDVPYVPRDKVPP